MPSICTLRTYNVEFGKKKLVTTINETSAKGGKSQSHSHMHRTYIPSYIKMKPFFLAYATCFLICFLLFCFPRFLLYLQNIFSYLLFTRVCVLSAVMPMARSIQKACNRNVFKDIKDFLTIS